MHCSVPEYCRPAVFHKGEQVALPEPAGLPARGGAGATTAALRGARRAASASEPWRPLAAATTDDFEKDSMLSDTTLLAGLQASGDSRHCKTEQGARSHRTWSRLLGLRRGPGG
ncbi:unnamed protein product [Prorocentrum cordatum]|uniref:Uncharacterized protein n=1 Tax=Prorocentrum cordatum TaxID=2364126 RepID=A0ABN9U8N1_9DINO|nr:unnamed protein product [Polarella glacialis]